MKHPGIAPHTQSNKLEHVDRLRIGFFFADSISLFRCSIFGIPCDVVVVVVVIQFLSGVFPLAEMAGFTPFLLQFLAPRPSTYLVSEHPPSSNQLSLSPLPLASSRSSSVVLAFSCQSLQDSEQPSKHYRHSSSVHVHTI